MMMFIKASYIKCTELYLKPESKGETMLEKIGIIGAMSEEIKILKEEMQINNEVTIAGMVFCEGQLRSRDVVLVSSGIGKVNAAMCTQVIIDHFRVSCVINVGIAGGLHKDIYPGDIVIADNLVQHDVDTSFFGSALGQIPRVDVFDFKCDKKLIELAKKSIEKIEDAKSLVGRIASGDQFMHEKEKLSFIHDEFGAYACEMEGAAIGQVCYTNEVPFIVIRSISDNAINGTHMDYEKFADIAILNSVFILREMLA